MIWGAIIVLLIRNACAQIRVLSPSTLVSQFDRNGNIVGTTATFGTPYYGERLLGQLVYAEHHGKFHCEGSDYSLQSFNQTRPNSGEDLQAKRLLKIVVVDRGHCTFVKKVLVAQKEKQAHAVIIVDTKTHSRSEDIKKVIMGDDGYGKDIKIPTIMISESDGSKLKNSILQNIEPVIVELAWDIPVNHVTSLDLWMSAGDKDVGEFLKNFKSVAQALEYNLDFTPHFDIFRLLGTDHNEMCLDSSARLCAKDPDGPGPITGRDVALESVRQLCIWKTTSQRDPGHPNHGAVYSARYWDYVECVWTTCRIDSGSDDLFGTACSTKCMGVAGIPHDTVQSCVDKHATTFLEAQLKNRAWSPLAVRINGWRYAGPLEVDTVTRQICSGYIEQPKECQLMIKPKQIFNIEEDVYEGLTLKEFLLGVLIIAVIFVAGLYFYKRVLTSYLQSSLREEVMLEVKSQMSTYAALGDEGTSSGRGIF